jgi:uncharacterized Zn finger protein
MFIVDGSKSWQRAKGKAAADRPGVQILSRGEYRVAGSGGNYYSVSIRAEGQGTLIDCACLAGVHGQGCYHGAAALVQHLAFVGEPAAAPRSKHLKHIESDLRTIERAADQMTADFELMDAIFRALRAARLSLAEYELELTPEAVDFAA